MSTKHINARIPLELYTIIHNRATNKGINDTDSLVEILEEKVRQPLKISDKCTRRAIYCSLRATFVEIKQCLECPESIKEMIP